MWVVYCIVQIDQRPGGFIHVPVARFAEYGSAQQTASALCRECEGRVAYFCTYEEV